MTFKIAGHLGGDATALAVSGKYLYAGIGLHLVVFDVSDPTHPVRLGESPALPDRVYHIALNGSLAYLADGFGGLQIFDVSQPEAPHLVGSADLTTIPDGSTGVYAMQVALTGSYALVVSSLTTGPLIFDVSDPQKPVYQMVLPIGYGYDLAMAGSFAYVVADQQLNKVDMTDPLHPGAPERSDVMGFTPMLKKVAAAGDKVYVAAGSKLFIFQSDQIVEWIGEVTTPFTQGVEELATDGKYVYLSGYDADWNASMQVIDVQNPQAPALAGVVPLGSEFSPLAVAASGGQVYAAKNFIHVISATDPAHPTEVGFYRPMNQVNDVAVSGSRAYLAADDGLHIKDVSSPEAPSELGFFPMSQGALRVVNAGDVTYVSDANGLYTLDVSDPAHPSQIARYTLPGKPLTWLLQGDRITLATGASLHILSTADPAALKEVSSITLPADVIDFDVEAGYVYALAGSNLHILDARGADLQPTATYAITQAGANQVMVVGGVAYLPGIVTLDVSDPALPKPLAVSPMPGQNSPWLPVNGYAYVAATGWQDGRTRIAVAEMFYAPEVALQPISQELINLPAVSAVVRAVSGGYLYITNGQGFGLLILRADLYTTVQPDQPHQLVSPDGSIQAQIPAGTYADSVTLEMTPLAVPGTLPSALRFAGIGFSLTAYATDGTVIHSLGSPVTFTIKVDPASLKGYDENTLRLYTWDSAQNAWTDAAESCSPTSSYQRDLVNHTISVQVCHLSDFVLTASALIYQVHLPIVNLIYTPLPAPETASDFTDPAR